MTINPFFRLPSKIILFGIIAFVIIGCGGVQKNNPAEAPWKNKDQGAPEGTKGEEGAPEIRQGASYEELIQVGIDSLKGGFIINASEAYSKALETQKDKPDAALSYAVTKIAGSVKEFSVLMPPGIDLLYFNTPLIGRWEIFPAPMAEEDSYLLRLASLGTKYLTPYAPKAKEQTKPSAPPAGGEKSPVAAPPGGTRPPTAPGGSPSGPGGSEQKPTTPGGETGERATQFFGGEREGAGGGLGGTNQPGGTGETGGAAAGGGGAIQYGGGGKPVENLNFDKDIFPDLMKEYKHIARTYNSGFINFEAVNNQAGDLKKIIDDIVEKLDYAKQNVDTEKFVLELPFKLDENKSGVYSIYFRSYDYNIIFSYMKLLQAELNYRLAYKSDAGNVPLYQQPTDKDTDGKLAPSEYYPADPFGVLKDDSAKTLGTISTLFSDGADGLVKALDEFHNNDKLMDYAGNLLIPANLDQLLLDKIANERNAYSDFQVFLTTGKGKREIFTSSEPIKVEINVSNLLSDKAPTSVAALLPVLDPKTFVPIPTVEGKNFPDPTWGGIFTEPLDDFSSFQSKVDISGTLTYQGEPLKDVQITLEGKDPVKTDEKGKFAVKDVNYFELTGVAADFVTAQIKTPIQAQIRSPWVIFDLMLVDQSMMPPMGMPGAGGTTSSPGEGGGSTTVAPPTGGGSSSGSSGRIDEIKREGEEEKGDGEKKEGGENPESPSTG